MVVTIIIGVDEGSEEVALDAQNFRGVVPEGECFEWVLSGGVDEAAGLEVGLKIIWLEGTVGGPIVGDEVTAAGSG